MMYERERQDILYPDKLYSRSEVLSRNCPIPDAPGIYAWYFKNFLEETFTQNCHQQQGLYLLYVGISPSEPPKNGKPPSSQSLRTRVKYHLNGNAEGSTLRFSIGCILSGTLGIQLRRVGSGKRLTFTSEGEAKLNLWLNENAFVIWSETPRPWEMERDMIHHHSLPLNLEHNQNNSFYPALSQIRKQARQIAKALPIIER